MTVATLARTDTGTLAPVRDYDPLGIGPVDPRKYKWPLAWGDRIEADLAAESGRSFDAIVADVHASIAHARAMLDRLGVGDPIADTQSWPALQSASVELPERVGGWTPPPAVFDRETALDNMKRRATPMALRPDPIAQLAPAALDQPDDGPLTAETEAWIGQGPADDDMPGRTPARPSRWDRFMGWLSDSGSRIENRLRAVGEDRRQG